MPLVALKSQPPREPLGACMQLLSSIENDDSCLVVQPTRPLRSNGVAAW
jgi:hypothetical protein